VALQLDRSGIRTPDERGDATEILPGVHQIGLIGARSLLIEGAQLTLVDAGLVGSARRVERYLDRLGWSPTDIDLIVLSHHHIDHVGGLPELRALSRAPVAAHVDEVASLRGVAVPPNPLPPPILNQVFEPLRTLVRLQPIRVDVLLRDGDPLPGCRDVQVVHAPGHTPGQVALHAPRDRWLFVADALQITRGRLAPPPALLTEDVARANETIRRFSDIDVDWLLFSHHGVRSIDSDELRDLARRVLDSRASIRAS
jgi:glyoxylase-like metal-dependent hydrolase (beta-lactamase superfamily II)